MRGKGRPKKHSPDLISALSKNSFGLTPYDLLLDDIKSYQTNFSSFSCCHVKRDGNTVAPFVARINPPNGFECVLVDNFSPGIQTLAELDLL